MLCDILQYLTHDDQEALLARVAHALSAAGVLIVREADASLGARFQATRLTERCCAWLRGEGRQS